VGQTTVISRVQPSDWATLRAVRLRALRDDPLSFGSTYEREAAFGDDSWREWATKDAEGDRMATFLARRGAGPVGMVAAYRDEDVEALFHVIAMWVAGEARGQGIGSKLLAHAEEWIRSCGGRTVQLNVTTAADDATRLYERAGFVRDGERRPSRHTRGLTEVSLRKSMG
jgi:ribosomal protein S18 acetylase RimI-like enzyme